MCEGNIGRLLLRRALTGDRTCSPGVCPDWESNQRHLLCDDDAQPTEPHRPGRWLGLLDALSSVRAHLLQDLFLQTSSQYRGVSHFRSLTR